MATDGFRGFLGLLVSALLLGFMSVIFTLIWVLHYREERDCTGIEFNLHPVLLVTDSVFIIHGIVVLNKTWVGNKNSKYIESLHGNFSPLNKPNVKQHQKQ